MESKHVRYGRSEKGRARNARYREANRMKRRESQNSLESHIARRRRYIAKQREKLTNQMEELNGTNA